MWTDDLKTYVIYHDGCSDGFGAAYAAWKLAGDKIHSYVPMSYHKPLPADKFKKGSRIVFVDCSPTLVQLEDLTKFFKVIIIDHHKTAKEMWDEYKYKEEHIDRLSRVEAHIDMDKSGSILAWEYFAKATKKEIETPLLLKYVQDRDLWQWRLPNSREISATLATIQRKFEVWDLYANNPALLIEKGRVILEAEEKDVKSLVKKAYLFKFGKHEIPVVNTPLHGSEVANRLLEVYPKAPFAACYHTIEKGMRKWELRSRGGFDVSNFAKKRGGGGHPRAAGFVESIEDI